MNITVQCPNCKKQYSFETQILEWHLWYFEDEEIEESDQDRTYAGTWELYCPYCEEHGDDTNLSVSVYVDAKARTGEQVFTGFTTEDCTVISASGECCCPLVNEDKEIKNIKKFFG